MCCHDSDADVDTIVVAARLIFGHVVLGRKAPELIHHRSLRRSFRHRTMKLPAVTVISQNKMYEERSVLHLVLSIATMLRPFYEI